MGADTITNDLGSLIDIGPKSVAWLRAVGITTVAELEKVGPAHAYALVAYRFGSVANRNLLYALAMGMQGRKYNSATDDEKRRLCEEAGIAFAPRKRAVRRA